jgi:preprotein translocase subunit SecY
MAIIPGNLQIFLGQHNTKITLNKVFDVLQHEVLVKSMAYTILDEIFVVLFPEIQNDLREISSQFRDELQKIRAPAS